MGIRDDLEAYKQTVLTNVTVKTDPDSIDPIDVGNIGTDLSDTIVDVLERSNQEEITSGSDEPLDAEGEDGDRYYQNTGTVVYEWRKTGGSWENKATLEIGVTFPDGPLTNLRTSILLNVVTVTPGSWAISNVIYQKLTQTQFTLAAADLNFLRYDLIYANTSGQILILTGTPSTTPAVPTLPANSIQVDVAAIPSSSSGDSPYLISSGPTTGEKLIADTSDVNGEYDASGDDIREFPVVTIYDQNGLQSPAQYDNENKKIVGMAASTAFTARFI